jgi:hypothetical protein
MLRVHSLETSLKVLTFLNFYSLKRCLFTKLFFNYFYLKLLKLLFHLLRCVIFESFVFIIWSKYYFLIWIRVSLDFQKNKIVQNSKKGSFYCKLNIDLAFVQDLSLNSLSFYFLFFGKNLSYFPITSLNDLKAIKEFT